MAPFNDIDDLQARRRAARERDVARISKLTQAESLKGDDRTAAQNFEFAQDARESLRATLAQARTKARAADPGISTEGRARIRQMRDEVETSPKLTTDGARAEQRDRFDRAIADLDSEVTHLDEETRDAWRTSARIEKNAAREALRREDGDEKNRLFSVHVAREIGAAAKNIRGHEQKLKELAHKEVMMLLAGRGKTGVVAPDLARIREEKADVEMALLEAREESPESFFVHHARQLKEYQRQIAAGELIKTPYVKAKMTEVLSLFEQRRNVLLTGHLGTGKTELLIEAAKAYTGKDPLIVSGSKNTTERDFTGRSKLEAQTFNAKDVEMFVREVSDAFKAWEQNNNDVSPEEKAAHQMLLIEAYRTKYQSSTVSTFIIGPLYEAMEQGRIVIFDEVNAIPAEILMAMNYLMMVKPGQIVTVKENGGRKFKVDEKFGIGMTANMVAGNVEYEGTQKMSAAFLSRVKVVPYDYLPMGKNKTMEHADEGDESFHSLEALVMEGSGARLPEGSLEKLFALAKLARITGDVVGGKTEDKAYNMHYEAGTDNGEIPKLNKAVMSWRALLNIVLRWKNEGFKHDLDHYLYTEFIGDTSMSTPADSRYIYQMAKLHCGFFKAEDGWEDVKVKANDAAKPLHITPPDLQRLVTRDDIKARLAARRRGEPIPGTARKHVPLKTYTLRQLVDAGFGQAPDRYEYPLFAGDVEPEAPDLEKEKRNEEVIELKAFLIDERGRVPDFITEIREVCSLEGEVCTI